MIAKRAFDLFLALAALLILSPLLPIVALLIRIDSAGPVFYRGVRVGRFARPFRIFKFRTMVTDAEQRGPSSTPEDDPRITRMGRWLRRYKLDELPQLFNVVRGEMSLVGPRPQVPWTVARYSDEERELLSVRPGMTDYASLAFHNEGEILRGSLDPDRDYLEKIHPEKMRLSLRYVREMSLVTDLRILRATVATVFGRRPVLEERASPGRGTANGGRAAGSSRIRQDLR